MVTRRIGKDLPQMPVIGRHQLVLDHHLLVAIGAEVVELEVAHLVLGGDKLQLTDAKGFGQRLQVVILGQPGREVTGCVLPGLSHWHAFELAEGWDGGHASEGTGSGRASTSTWPESRRGRSRSRVRRRLEIWH